MPLVRNWARNQSARPRRLIRPASEAEVCDLLARAQAGRVPLKVMGAGHSWTSAAMTDGWLLQLDRLAGLIAVDPVRHRVTVQAGMRLKDLNRALHERGLGLSNMGSVAEQSVAGAISTGTHGSGLGFGNLATQVVELKLATPGGGLRTLSAQREPELFRAARVSLGALGVITEVTLQCEPAFRLHERGWLVPFDLALEHLDAWVERHEHLKLWWLPHTDLVWVRALDRTSQPVRGMQPLMRALDEWVLGPVVFRSILAFGGRFPRWVPAINRLVRRVYFTPLDRVGWGPSLFTLPMPARHLETEWAFAAEQAADALRMQRRLIEERGLAVNFISELRFAAGDDALLSPAQGRASCFMGAYAGHPRLAAPWFSAFEHEARLMGARPHWGKAFDFDAAYLEAQLPGWRRFCALRAELDPHGILVNRMVAQVCGLERSR